MACVQPGTLLVSMRGLDAQVTWSSVTMGGVPPLARALLRLFMLAMVVRNPLALLLTDAGMVNVQQVLALAQFLKVATVVTLQLQTALFALKRVLLAKCGVLMVAAMFSLHARQHKDVI
jgi:hypothetical protein